MTFPDQALRDVVNALPHQDERQAYWLDGDAERGHVYCGPCLDRALPRLLAWKKRGWTQDDWGERPDTDPKDVAEDCHHCGARVTQNLNHEGVREELLHYEGLDDITLAAEAADDLQRLAHGLFLDDWCGVNTDVPGRVRALLLRYLRCQGRPFDPSRHQA